MRRQVTYFFTFITALTVILTGLVTSASASFDTYKGVVVADGIQQPMAPAVPPDLTLEWGFPINFTDTEDYYGVDTGVLYVEFYKDTFGYNKIHTSNQTVLVYDDRLVLERQLGGPTYTQVGTPQSVSYEKVSEYAYNFTRHYDDYLGTTYNVTYSLDQDSPIKISVELHVGTTRDYRLAWYASGVTPASYTTDDYGYTFGNTTGDYSIGIDWYDVYSSFGDIISSENESHAQGRQVNVYFDLGELTTGTDVLLDPQYKGRIRTDREKLDACESLIQSYIDYFNDVGQSHHAGSLGDEQWHVFAHRTTWDGGNVFSSYLIPLLEERNDLRESIRQSHYTEEDWFGLTPEDKWDAMLLMYGDKAEVRQLDTSATCQLLDKLQSIDVSALEDEIPPDPTEDFTTYTEVDPNSKMTITTSKVDMDGGNTRLNDYYIYKDFTADHFDALNTLIEVYASSSCSYNYENVGWGFSDAINDMTGWAATEPWGGWWMHPTYGAVYLLGRGNFVATDGAVLADDTLYYITLTRIAGNDTITLYIYSDASRESLVDELTLPGYSTDKWRYCYGMVNNHSGGDNRYFYGYNQNMDLQEGGEPELNITNSPSSWAMGTVSANTTYWAHGSTPAFPLNVTGCTFNVTNNSGASINISVYGANWTSAGVNWTLAPTQGLDQVRIRVGQVGDDEGDMITLTEAAQIFIASLADNASQEWEIAVDTPTAYSDGYLKSTNVTITAVLE